MHKHNHPTPADASPTKQTNSTSQPPPTQHIHNFSDIPWDMENEPPIPEHSAHQQMFHLLTITGLLIVANYPHDTHTLGEHYLAWAPLTSEPTLTIH